MQENIYKVKIDEIYSIEKDLVLEREKFIDSLWDLLTPEQVATVVTFERRFRSEVRGMLREHGKGRNRR